MEFGISSLDVFYNDITVGVLKKVEDKIYFQYFPKWIEQGFSISPISLPLSNSTFSSDKPFFEGVFGVFYDSLPDGWGRLLLNKYFASKGINYEALPILDKLSLTNCMSKGALTYKPSNSEDIAPLISDLDLIAKSFKDIYDNNNFDDLDNAYALGGSSGGARPKAYLKIDNEEWIVKFPSKMDPGESGYDEFIANSLAKSCGINTNEFKLFSSNECKGYFGAKRFDRVQNKSVHMITLSSILETSYRIPNLDYELLFKVAWSLTGSKECLYEVFRRMCFNILYGNKDDHGNNFSFLYDESKKSYVLSPFYDITKTPNKLEHEMSLCGNGKPNKKDLINFISKTNLDKKKCLDIINEIENVIKGI